MSSGGQIIDGFCRLCAVESQNGVIIYSAEGENLCLEKKIISCLRIEVSRDDMLPKRICQSCNLLLEDYYRFSERAIQVQQTLCFLLGLRLREHNEKPVTQPCDGVKVESNVVKKEFDEFVIHPSDQSSVSIPEEYLSAYRQKSCRQMKQSRIDDNVDTDLRELSIIEICGSETVGNDVQGSSEVKHISTHQRGILGQKHSVQDNFVEDLNNIDPCYFSQKNNIHKDYFKQLQFENKNLLQGSNHEIDVPSTKAVEEETNQLEKEWEKKLGIICNLCKRVLQDKAQLRKHYICSHKKKPIFTCSYCENSLADHAFYKTHVLVHINTGRFKCKFCDRKFFSKEFLQIHLVIIHDQMKIHICEVCAKSFISESRFDLHKKKHKNILREDFQCTECGKVLQTKGGLSAHRSVHKRGRHFMCHICGKTFTQKINMQQHVKHHKGEKPHSCDICEKSFAERSQLNRHKSFHSEERPFQCSTCRKMYKTQRCLKVHSQTHWNSRPYICSSCGKGFLSSTKLKQHYNCHTGERPFACKYCERTFTNYPNWLKHVRRRHKVDHKTGLSLKKERQTAPENSEPRHRLETCQTSIEFVEVPDIEIKEDGGDSGQSQHSVLSVLCPAFLRASQCPSNPLPGLPSPQTIHSDESTA